MTLDLTNKVEVNFGYVPLFGWSTKTVTVPSSAVIGFVETCPKTNPLNLMFNVTKWANMPDGNHKVTLTYHPLVKDLKNYGYFQVKFNTGKTAVICASGETKSAKITCKTQRLSFHCCFPNKPTTNNALELVNITDIPAEFHFDVNQNDMVLRARPVCGVIPANSSVRILLTFTPAHLGLFYRRISCFLQCQAPILVDLYGIYSKSALKTDLRKIIYTNQYFPSYLNNYECYLNDILTQVPAESLPLLLINRRFIDFGYFNVNYELEPAIQEFQLTNNSMIPFKIKWEIDKRKCFRIVPNMDILEAQGTVTYKAKFLPKLPDNYYSEDIICSILWGPEFEFLASFPLIVNLLGNTFQEGLCSWDPLYSLPTHRVKLPNTVPDKITYSSFTIYNTSHLPLFFKFVAPKTSKFVIKPMQGLITTTVQIIIVRLFPGLLADVGFVENWELFLNISKRIAIEFWASAELPALKFENNAHISFLSTNIHSVQCKPFAVRNCTRLPISLSFRGAYEKDLIYADLPSYELSPNQQISPIIHFYPHHEGDHHTTLVAKLLYSCNDGTKLGTESIVTVTGTCEKAKVIGFPENIVLDDVLFSEWVYGKFYVNNPSFCKVNVTLRCKPRSYGSKLDNFSISSEYFVLDLRETKEITLGVQLFSPGIQNLEIFYYLTKLEDGVIDEYSVEKHLINVDVYCQYPSVKIEDIRAVNEKITFSKYFYWEMLQINKLNEALANVKDWNKPKVIKCKVPENEQGSNPLIVEFLIHNTCGFELFLTSKVVIDCACRKVSLEGHGMSYWKPICDHKNEFTFDNDEIIFNERGNTTVQATINYETIDKSIFQIELCVCAKRNRSVKRTITLLIERKCFEARSLSLDLAYPEVRPHEFLVELDPIFIGENNPPVQAVWLYNNSAFQVSYKICRNKFKRVFNCINRKGTIACCSTHPLLIKFTPYELKRYKGALWLISREQRFLIRLIGEGIAANNLSTYKMSKCIPLTTKFTDNTKATVLTSVEHIIFKPLTIHSATTFAVFIRNNRNVDIYFHWKRKHLGGVYNIEVEPEQGILVPAELIMCQVQLESYSIPARLSDYIVCILIDYALTKDYVIKRTISDRFRVYYDSFFCWTHNEQLRHKLIPVPPRSVMPVILKIGISFHSIDEMNPGRFHIKTQFKRLRNMALGSALQETKVVIQNEEYNMIRQVFGKLLWDVIKSNYFKTCILLPPKDIYYLPLAIHKRRTVLPHARIIQKTILHYVFEVLENNLLLELLPDEKLKKCIIQARADTCCKKPLDVSLNNKYHKDILEKGLLELESHLCNPASCEYWNMKHASTINAKDLLPFYAI